MRHPKEIYEYDWEQLDEGETVRIHCGHELCDAKADSFTITRTLDGCIYNCFRCGCPGAPGIIYKSSNPSQALERLKRLRKDRHSAANSNDNNANDNCVLLPKHFTPMMDHAKGIPAQAYGWLYQYELDDDDIFNFNIGYAPRLEQVVIPIYNDADKLIGWQGRNIFHQRNTELYKKGLLKHKPVKYYTEYNNIYNIKLYYNINKYNIYNINNININNNKIIIVEDIISAIKVFNKFKYNTTALLNSTLTNNTITDLNLRTYQDVYVWLDPDAHIKATKASLKWSQHGVNAHVIRSDGDPKEIPYKEMKL